MGKPHFYIGKLQGKVGRGEGGTSRPFFHSGQAGRQKDKRQDQIHLDQNGKAIERHREREMALIYSLLETPPGRFQPTPDWGSIRRKKVKRYLSEPYHALSITHTHTLNTHKQHGRRGIVSPPYKNCTYTHQLKKAKVVPPHLFPGKGKARTPPPPSTAPRLLYVLSAAWPPTDPPGYDRRGVCVYGMGDGNVLLVVLDCVLVCVS